jgi:hypothetical protein
MEVLGSILPDGTLVLDEPLRAEPGRVRVILEPMMPSQDAPPREDLMAFVQRKRRELENLQSRFMNDDEVSAWIEELRSEDDRIARAYQHEDESKRS